MLLEVYRFFSRIGIPVWRFILQKRIRSGKEDPTRIGERLGIPTHENPSGDVVWIHAASVGETLSIIPVIEHYKEAPVTFLITTQTRTSAKVIQGRNLENIIHQFAPIDSQKCVEKFLDYWQPVLCLRLESELWPEALLQIKHRNIPNILVNARLSERSEKLWGRFQKTFQKLCASFNIILVQNKVIEQRFMGIAPQANLLLTGNLKYVSSPLPNIPQDLTLMRDLVRGKTVWLATSTHAGEEEIIIKTHEHLLKIYPHTLTIIVPRHPERGLAVAQLCEDNNQKCTLRSKGDNPDNIYIADTLGELGLWYRLSPVSLIGGSLCAGMGGHNLIEAAQLRSAILSGKFISSFTEEYAQFWREKAAICVNAPSGIADAVISVWEGAPETRNLVDNAYTITQDSTSILNVVTCEIDRFLYA